MYTLGNKTSKVVSIAESRAICLSFIGAEDLKEGDIVKIKASDKKVEKVTAPTDEVFGVVEKGCFSKKDNRATILTQFCGEYIGVADEALAFGDKVAITGQNDEGRNKFKKGVAGNFAVGIALEDATNEKPVRVGMFRMFNKI